MVRPSLRSRSLARVYVRLPSSRVTIHYYKRRPEKAKCAMCKRPLHGVPALRPVDLRKLPKTSRRPERPYGGYLCPTCLRTALKRAIRGV